MAVMNNIESGFDLWNVETCEHLYHFIVKSPSMRFPKQVAFGEKSNVVVRGSDHGLVYVFDRKTGQQRDILHHATRGLVQTIAVSFLTTQRRASLIGKIVQIIAVSFLTTQRRASLIEKKVHDYEHMTTVAAATSCSLEEVHISVWTRAMMNKNTSSILGKMLNLIRCGLWRLAFAGMIICMIALCLEKLMPPVSINLKH